MAHNEFDDFFGDDDEKPVADTRADGRLYRVPLTRIAPNLVNPRQDFGTVDQLIDFGKSLARRQNQPCPVVSRNAYLKLWPEPADRLKDVDYILVSGERRYRAAHAVGLPTLDCVVNDDFAKDRKTFMEAVVSENVDRQNFDPIEEAYAVQALVAEFGSNRAVAQHFERVDGWVTQRVLLTHLAREVQDLVRQKTIPLEAARTLGKHARDNAWGAAEQLAWWEEEQERRAAAAAARSAARKAGQQTAAPVPAPAEPVAAPAAAPSFTAVKQADPEPREAAAEPARELRFTAVNRQPEQPETYTAVYTPADQPAVAAPTPEPVARSESIPEPRTDSAPPVAQEEDHPRQLPYTDAVYCVHHMHRKMDTETFAHGARVWLKVLKEQHPDHYRAVYGDLEAP